MNPQERIKVTPDMNASYESSLLDQGIKVSLEEVGGIIKRMDSFNYRYPVFEMDRRPNDAPLYGLVWKEVDTI